MIPPTDPASADFGPERTPSVAEAVSKLRLFGHFLANELKPAPGRARASARIVVAVLITVILSETLRVPFPDFSAYLVFFVVNENGSRSFKLGLAVMVAVTMVLAVAIGIDICFLDAPWFRLPTTLFLVGAAVWLSRTLVMGTIGRLLAVVLALNLSLADVIFNPEMLTRTTLWLWSVVGLAVGVTIVVNKLFERHMESAAQEEAQKAGPFIKDAFSNPEYLRFTLRTSAAVIACEIFMNAVTWPGIRTSLITCVVTALATRESQNQKQALRLLGASVGGVIGLASILWIVPSLDSIVGLVILIGVCTYAFAWVAVGSQRSSYAGFQMALAFYLMLLPGFTTSIDLTSIRDRFVGILIGIAAMWLFFLPYGDTQVKPKALPAGTPLADG